MNIEHETEQREAARVEFAQLWTEKLWPRAVALGAREQAHALVMDIAWQAFRAGQKSGTTPIVFDS